MFGRPAHDSRGERGAWWRPILALVLLSAVVQAVMTWRAAVPALDSIRSVAAAEALLRSPTLATFASEPEPPLFPVWLATIHRARWALSEQFQSPPPNWGTSTQLAAILPLIVWVVPVYLLARCASGKRTAFLAGLLGCWLPTAAQLGAEGLADSLFVLPFTCAVAMLAASHPFSESKRQVASRLLPIVGGMLVGLAMLVRVEAVLLLAAAGIAIAFSRRETLGQRLRQAVVTVSLSGAGVSLVIAPWLIAADALSPSAVVARLCSRAPARDGWVFNESSNSSWAPGGAVSWEEAAPNFDSKEPGASTRRRGLAAALAATADEYLVATGYVLFPLAVIAMILKWKSRSLSEWDRLATTGTLLWLILAFVNASTTGYLSSRHLLPTAVFMLPAAASGLLSLISGAAGGLTASVEATSPKALTGKPPVAPGLWLRWLAPAAVFLFWSLWCLQPIHGDRSGHREAGDWLALHTKPADRVLDSYGWTALYSRCPTYRYDAAREAFADPRLGYVVVEQRELESGSRRAATLNGLLARQATRVARFDPPRRQSPVLIFQWRPALAHNGALGTARK